MRVVLTLFLIVIFYNSYSQRVVKKYIVDFTEEKHEFWTELDTNYYYLIFENGFENDKLEVYADNNIKYSDTISTNNIVGLATVVKVLKCKSNKVYFTLNDSDKLHIPIINFQFILIDYQGDFEIIVRYSSNYPAYN